MGATFNALTPSLLGSVRNSLFYRALSFVAPAGIADNPLILVLIAFIEGVVILAGFSIPWMVAASGRIKDVRRIRQKKDWDYRVMISIAVLGYGAFFCFIHAGLSQVYFIFGIIPFVQILVFCFFENSLQHKKRGVLWSRRFFIAGMACGMLITVISLGQHVHSMMIHNEQARNGVHGALQYKGISAGEIEALHWLRENTKTDDLIAGNRLFTKPEETAIKNLDSKFFYYSAYSERRIYLEGYYYSTVSMQKLNEMIAVNKGLFDLNNKDRAVLARSHGIGYLLVSKLSDPALDLTADGVRRCFSNDDVDIYNILRNKK